MLKVYNSLTNKKEEFKPIHENHVNMYVCGPTVYNYIHIGNARPVIVFDVVKRYLEHLGYSVKYVSNFTDVDDKIIATAIEENVSESEITEKYIEAYLNDCEGLNSNNVDERLKVTDNMDGIIQFIDDLVQNGYAYAVNGDVYFRVSKYEDYGKLSNQKIDDLMSGARIDANPHKENPLDFTLWKETSEGIKWDSPWGMGRPGWHTECVVMIDNTFGEMIDIHGGGNDLKFPHHENEIAQAKAHSNHGLAKYWMHNGFVNINNEKMSKSLGNFTLTKDLLEKYDGNVLRLAMLSTHYRQPINFSQELLESSKKMYEKITRAYKQVSIYLQVNEIKSGDEIELTKFEEAMNDDFNTSNAITELIDITKQLNTYVRSNDHDKLFGYYKAMTKVLKIMGIVIDVPNLTVDDIDIYKKWEQARKDKDFDTADKYRDELTKKNII